MVYSLKLSERAIFYEAKQHVSFLVRYLLDFLPNKSTGLGESTRWHRCCLWFFDKLKYFNKKLASAQDRNTLERFEKFSFTARQPTRAVSVGTTRACSLNAYHRMYLLLCSPLRMTRNAGLLGDARGLQNRCAWYECSTGSIPYIAKALLTAGAQGNLERRGLAMLHIWLFVKRIKK